jgi:hyperosmotically inducible periplasmic protein
MRLRSTLFGAAAGAAAAYLLDPDQGRGRRARLADQAEAMLRRTSAAAAGRARHAVSAAVGTVLEARSRLMPAPADDTTLRDRIRSEALGHSAVPAGRINLDVVDGRATLRGELDDPGVIEDVVRRVRAVPGVVGVENLLHTSSQEPAANKRAAVRASELAGETTPPTGDAIE